MADRSGRAAGRLDEVKQASLTPTSLTPARFADRYQASWPTLWSIAAAVLGERAGADDVVQEAALIALGKLGQFDPDSNFTAWMGRIVRFVALNHARRRVRSSPAPVDPHALDVKPASNGHAQSVSPLTGRGQLSAISDGFDDRVLAALRTLDETARACLLLRTILDMPYREISLALDIAEGTAMSHVHRARTVLRERLAPALAAESGGHA